MKQIAVLTSGGDAPGMNACIRAVVRTASAKGVGVTGVQRGYAGLIAGDFREMGPRDVSNVIQTGGSMLKSSRCPEMRTPEGRKQAVANLKRAGVEGLVVIGGNGSSAGAHALATESDLRVVSCASTIDNDLWGTDATIGFDSAVNTALDAIDRLRDTAHSHDRVFFVEVMGRGAGFIALASGIGGGAEVIFLPEVKGEVERAARVLEEGKRKGKKSFIFVVAEGEQPGGAIELAKSVQALAGLEYRVAILGHIQRGGPPTARDRLLATRLGVAAVEALLYGRTDVMVGERGGELVLVPLSDAISRQKPLDPDLVRIVDLLNG